MGAGSFFYKTVDINNLRGNADALANTSPAWKRSWPATARRSGTSRLQRVEQVLRREVPEGDGGHAPKLQKG